MFEAMANKSSRKRSAGNTGLPSGHVAEHNQMTDYWIHWILHALKSEVNNGLVGMDPVIPTFTFPDESLFLTPTHIFVPFLTNCAEQHSVKYPPVLDRY